MRSHWGAALATGVVSVFLAALLAGCGGGAGAEAFCRIAQTSSLERTEAEIDQYYEELGAVAPGEISDDVAVLREGWQQTLFSFEQAQMGDIEEVSRPPEVTEAAINVSGFAEENCGFEGGVYLVFPEEGF